MFPDGTMFLHHPMHATWIKAIGVLFLVTALVSCNKKSSVEAERERIRGAYADYQRGKTQSWDEKTLNEAFEGSNRHLLVGALEYLKNNPNPAYFEKIVSLIKDYYKSQSVIRIGEAGEALDSYGPEYSESLIRHMVSENDYRVAGCLWWTAQKIAGFAYGYQVSLIDDGEGAIIEERKKIFAQIWSDWRPNFQETYDKCKGKSTGWWKIYGLRSSALLYVNFDKERPDWWGKSRWGVFEAEKLFESVHGALLNEKWDGSPRISQKVAYLLVTEYKYLSWDSKTNTYKLNSEAKKLGKEVDHSTGEILKE